MAKEIKWTKQANKRFLEISECLDQEWGSKVTSEWIYQSLMLIETLAEFPNLGTVEDKRRKIHGFVLTKHQTLFYRVTNEEFIILNLFDNRFGPNRKKY